MDKYKFVKPHLGFEVGRVVDESDLRLGILRTLESMSVLEKLNDDKLDDKKNVKPKRTASKSGGSKKTSASKRK